MKKVKSAQNHAPVHGFQGSPGLKKNAMLRKTTSFFRRFFRPKIDEKSIKNLRKMMLAAKLHQKSVKTHFCRRFFMEMMPSGFKKVPEGRPRGHPATLRQAFLGPDG